MPPLNVWLSWSSGKDSAYSLYTLQQQPDHYQVVGLLTTVNEAANRVAMHAVRAKLLQKQAEATGLPLHQVLLMVVLGNVVIRISVMQIVELELKVCRRELTSVHSVCLAEAKYTVLVIADVEASPKAYAVSTIGHFAKPADTVLRQCSCHSLLWSA